MWGGRGARCFIQQVTRRKYRQRWYLVLLMVTAAVTLHQRRSLKEHRRSDNDERYRQPFPPPLHKDTIDRTRLVIGLASDLPQERLLAWIHSLRRHSRARVMILLPRSELRAALMGKPWRKQQEEKKRKNEVHHENFLRRVALEYEVDLVGFVARRRAALYHITTLRFFVMRRLLEGACGAEDLQEVQWVVTTDVKDTIFQGDPFRSLAAGKKDEEDALHISMEPMKIQGLNAQWIESCFGPEATQRVRGYDVSCSGVTLGTRRAFWNYVNATTRGVFAALNRKQAVACSKVAVDQGVHNMVLYAGDGEYAGDEEYDNMLNDRTIRPLYWDDPQALATVMNLNFFQMLTPELGFHVSSLPVTVDFNFNSSQSGIVWEDVRMHRPWKRTTRFSAPLESELVEQFGRGVVPYAIVHQYNRLWNLTLQIIQEYAHFPEKKNVNVLEKEEEPRVCILQVTD